MNNRPLFDFVSYIHRLTKGNVLAASRGYAPQTCSGIDDLTGLLQNMRSASAMVAVSDVSEESTTRISGGWYKRRVFTVFIVTRYTLGDMASYGAKLAECREIFRQFHSRMLLDEADLRNDLCYLNVERIKSREFGKVFLNGHTGLLFQIAIDEPLNLCYDKNEWTL